jgi:hypothetical protein
MNTELKVWYLDPAVQQTSESGTPQKRKHLKTGHFCVQISSHDLKSGKYLLTSHKYLITGNQYYTTIFNQKIVQLSNGPLVKTVL